MNYKLLIIAALLVAVLVCGALVAFLPESEPDDDPTGDDITVETTECAHKSFGEWKDSGNYHTRKCKSCAYTESAEHSYGTDNKCKTCGKAKPSVATHECVFDKSIQLNVVEATCSTKGSYTSPCKVEGCTKTTKTETPVAEHSYTGSISSYNEGLHLIHCKWCDKFKYQAHAFNTGSVTKAATCTGDGEKTFTCTSKGCGYVKKEIITATGHKFANGTCTVCKVNCTSHTYVNFKCKTCGAACPHKSFDSGVCKDCNYICSHSTYQNGVCTTCGIECTHPESSKYVNASNIATHNATCTKCHITFDEPHYDNDGDNYCDHRECPAFLGTTEECPHPSSNKYVDAWGSTAHFFTCTNCHTTDLSEAHYDSNGDGMCDASGCGYDMSPKTEPEECTHVPGSVETSQVGCVVYEYVNCSLCGEGLTTNSYMSHSFDSSGTCTVCGYVYPYYDPDDEDCPHNNTNYNGDSDGCLQMQYTYCEDCGAMLSDYEYYYIHNDYNDDGICDNCGSSAD